MKLLVTTVLVGSFVAVAVGLAALRQNPPATQSTQQIAPLGEDQRVAAADIDKLLENGKVLFLDVREPKELEELGAHEGYVNIPLGQLERRLNELPKDKAILTA